MRRRSLTASLTLLACAPSPDLEGLLRQRLASAEARAHGAQLFSESCQLCHGARGDGRGARHASLSGRPPDFTDPAWRRGHGPELVFTTIKEGKSGTSMPAWRSWPDDDIADVTVHVLGLAPTDARAPRNEPRGEHP